MKKRFINDMGGFFLLVFLALTQLSMMMLFIINKAIMLGLLFWGPQMAVSVGWVIIKTEFISLNNEKIKCCIMFKKSITINISDIKEITDQKSESYGFGDMPAWKIDDHLGNSIFIVQTKSRKKIIEYIQEQINC